MDTSVQSHENKLSILLIDDDPILLKAIGTILQRSDYDVVTCSNGAAGLETLQKNPNRFFLIFLDKSMPCMTGPQCLRQIRLDPRFKKIPIVMLTTEDDPESIVDLVIGGADDYLIKPVDAEQLIAMSRSFHPRWATI